MQDLIIVGGGASGLFGAVQAVYKGLSVTVFEKEKKVGKKLAITGKGRCNITNIGDNKTVMDNILRNSKFLYSSLAGFSTADTISFFENLGVPLKTERGGRVFPQSDKASDVVSALENAIKQAGGKIVFQKVSGLIVENSKCLGVVTADGKKHFANNVMIATGGMSYPKTGSTGDGYKFAQTVGHNIVEPLPSLVPITTVQRDFENAVEFTLKNIKLSLLKNNKTIYSELGEITFVKDGLGGALSLTASGYIDPNSCSDYQIIIDLKPALDEKKLDTRICRDFKNFSNMEFSQVLRKLVPKEILPMILKRSGIAYNKPVNQITAEQRANLVNILKHLKFDAKALHSINEAIVTRGGVNLKEIDPKTCKSKLCENLYFCGEVLDIDATTGGYNLQIAFCTANSAIKAMCGW